MAFKTAIYHHHVAPKSMKFCIWAAHQNGDFGRMAVIGSKKSSHDAALVSNPFGGGRQILWGSRTLILTLILVPWVFAQKIYVEFDQAADFSLYKTFEIRGGQLNSKYSVLNNELVKKRIEADIIHALAAKGLVMVSSRPDLNVHYHFGSARKMVTEVYPAGWRGWGTRVVKVPYAEGTLVVDLRDSGTRSLVWRGIASEEKSDPAKLEGKLDDMVRKAIAKYPPKKK